MMCREYPSHDVHCKPISNLNMGIFSISECKIEKSTMKRMHASMISINTDYRDNTRNKLLSVD